MALGKLAGTLAMALAASNMGVRVVPPALPPQAKAGGEVLLKVSVSPVGQVRQVEVLRPAPPFSDTLASAVRQWQFGPAVPGQPAAEREILVAGMFRPPTLLDMMPPGSPGHASGVSTIPIPTRWERPLYPPRALGDGVVVLEASIGEDGTVEDLAVVASSPAFDETALAAARRWAFRPALSNGSAVPSVAYLVFGFPQPLVSPGPRK